MAQRKDVQPEWVITTFGTLVDGLNAATTSPDTSLIPPRSAPSDPGPQVNIGILQRLGFVQTGKMLDLPTHRASEHRYLLLRGPVFLFDVTPQHTHRPRSPSGGMMSLAGRWERGAMPPGWLALYASGLR